MKIAPHFMTHSDNFHDEVQNEVNLGADFIKIIATGGFASPDDSPEEQYQSYSQLKTIIDTAHSLNTTVTAHAYTSELVTTLAELGIDGIEHASLIDKKTATLLEEKDIYVVPTFCQYDDIINLDKKILSEKPDKLQNKLYNYREQLIESRKTIIDSNICLGYGTDIVYGYQNYECGREFSSWLLSGIDPYRILKAATSINAKILGIDKITGTIKPQKQADIAAWKRDILTDDKALLDCAFVMKGGIEVKPFSVISKYL